MIADDPGRPRGRVLLDTNGREIARFEETVRDDGRVADLFTLHVEPDHALHARQHGARALQAHGFAVVEL